jgi:outer membrane autotransporter protein
MDNRTSRATLTVNLSGGSIAAADATEAAIGLKRSGDVVNITGGTIVGKISTQNAGVGAVVINAPGGFTSGGDFGDLGQSLGSIAVNGGTFHAGHNLYGNTAVASAATLDVAQNALTVDGTLRLASGSTLQTTLVNSTALGKLTSSGAATVDANANVRVTAGAGIPVANGQRFVVVDGTGGTGVSTLSAGKITSSGVSYSFRQDTTTGCVSGLCEDLALIAIVQGYNAAGLVQPNNTAFGAGAALETISAAGTSNADMALVIQAFNGFTEAQLNAQIQKAAPVANHSSIQSSMAASAAPINIVEARMAQLRGDTRLAAAASTGVAAGGEEKNQAFWLKGFGTQGKQDRLNGFDGYTSNTSGIAMGADQLLASGWTVGLAASYASTRVDEQDARSGDWQHIDGGQLTAYASRDVDAAYLGALLAYNQSGNTTSRDTALSRTATGSFSSSQWTARVGGGYRIPVATGTTFIPTAGLQYANFEQAAYSEAGAGALGLSYDGVSVARTQSSLGARLTHDSAGGDLRLETRLAWLHDFQTDGLAVASSFNGGGTSFVTPGQKTEGDSWTAGVGAVYSYGKGASLSVQYDHEGRTRYAADALHVTGRWAF